MSALTPESIKLAEDYLAKTAYETDGDEFARLLRDEWRTVKWNGRQGRANLGGLKISWVESGNDPAVIVTIEEHPFLKSSPESMMEGLEKVRKAMSYIG